MSDHQRECTFLGHFVTIVAAIVFILLLGKIAYAAHPNGDDADSYKQLRNYEGALVNKPIYDPASKSYFELLEIKGGVPYGRAVRIARSKIFNGIRGRLATIRSKETQHRLDSTLRPDGEAWIGLWMFCSGRVLLWSDGKNFRKGKDFVNWGPVWHYTKSYIPCKSGDKYAGVTLAPVDKAGYVGKGLRWFAIAPSHAVAYLIIEYPTGGK